ncbi:phosphatidylcholine transfer protein [Erpetoichthys calabaricus]|uniref:Phosphatidylcholine transfer protein n=1 Tax=Erpetoichthys calabaricus TaxID=27687 RepID=A0A8C4STL8_ERPCA|nr:phosphatidylcholine transfer protein [Erpetoichthys calabaricus]
MALQFSDEQFQEAWRELDDPQLEGEWELFTSSMGIQIYRLYDQDSGLYEYKIFGSLADYPPDECAAVYMDLEYRKHWDGYVKELSEKVYDGQTIIYWEVKYPFPLSNRDYTYIREMRELKVNGRRIWVTLAKNVSVPQCPEKSSVIRVQDYKQSLAMESDGEVGTRVYMNYFDNPGGMIPSWLINWAAKSGVPSFLTDMKKACKNYAAFQQRAGR